MTLIKRPLPAKMSGRPYGKDEHGRSLSRVQGVTARATVEYAVLIPDPAYHVAEAYLY